MIAFNATVLTIEHWYYPQYLTRDGWFFFYNEQGEKVAFFTLTPAFEYLAALRKEGKIIYQERENGIGEMDDLILLAVRDDERRERRKELS